VQSPHKINVGARCSGGGGGVCGGQWVAASSSLVDVGVR